MDVTLLGTIVAQYGGSVGGTKILIDLLKNAVPMTAKQKSRILPLMSIIIAGLLNYVMKGGQGGFNDIAEGIMLGLTTSKAHDLLKPSSTDVATGQTGTGIQEEVMSEEDALLLSKYEAHDTSHQ